MTKSDEAPVGKKSMPEYESNPSLPVVSQKARVGTRRLTNKAGDKCMIVSEAGEILAPAGFHEIVEVDKTQFVKVYVDGVAAFNDLGKPGAKVFKMVYSYVLKNPDTDAVFLYYKDARSMARATFDRGIVELLAKEIIYKSTRPNLYFLNIDYMFNGNRLALVKEYRLKASIGEPKDVQESFQY